MTKQINTQPQIKTLPEYKLIGKRLTMSLAANKTFMLWQSFMPRRKEIKSKLNDDLFSMQVYSNTFDFSFTNPDEPFEKWAAIAVADFEYVPEEMETYILPGGLYAVFFYKGLNTDTRIFKYIFGTWLPNSNEYLLDNRPHFEILGSKYKNGHPDSEEEIWIPVKPK